MFLFPSTLSSTITCVSVDAQQLSAVDHSEVSGVADGGHFPLRPPYQRRPHPSSLQLRWGISVFEILMHRNLSGPLFPPTVQGFHFSLGALLAAAIPPLLEGSLLLGNKSLVLWDLSHGSGRPHQFFLLWNRGGAGLGPPHIRAQLNGETLGQLFFPVWCSNLDSHLRI